MAISQIADEIQRTDRQVADKLPARERVIKIEWGWQYYPKQAAFLNNTERYTVVEASTKAGKTAGCLRWLFELASKQRVRGRNFYWVAPIYSTAKIAYRRLKHWLAPYVDTGLFRFNDSESFLELPNGSVMWFKGSDNPESLYGDDVYGAVIDEASRCKEDAWHAVRSTLTATRGVCKIIGNVKGKKNWAFALARKAEGGERDFAYFKLTCQDAVDGGIYSADEIEDARRTLPEHVFRELYMAEAADDEGNPFGQGNIEKCIMPRLSELQPVVFGIDIAKSVDWTVIIGLDANCDMCYYDRFQADWAATMARIEAAVGNVPTLIDSTGVGDAVVEQLQRQCPDVTGFKFSSQSKQQIMEGLAYRLAAGELGIIGGEVATELSIFEYSYTASGVRYSAPEGFHDDAVCSLALAVKHYVDETHGLVLRMHDIDDSPLSEYDDDEGEGWRSI